MNTKIAIIGAGRGGEMIEKYLSDQGMYSKHGLSGVQIKYYDEMKGRHPDEIGEDEIIIISSSNMPFRRRMFKKFPSHRFMNVNRSAYQPKMGTSNIIFPDVNFDWFCEVGDNNVISTMTVINHHCKIGSGNLFGPGCLLSGAVTVGDDCLIGSGVIIEPNVTIGNNVIIPSGTVVVGNVKTGTNIKAKRVNSSPFYQGERI